ncbi:MAG: carbohydrate kinase family protein, partial [Janthinobacterium sp.]
MIEIITIGSATKDAFLISKGFKLINTNKFSTGVGECFAYGEKIEVSDLNFTSGGGATNAAATMSNFGIKAGVYTQVGDDLFGHEIISELKKRRIDVRNLHLSKKHKTAYSTILLSPHGDRTILVYRGASHDFEAKQLNPGNLKAKWFYLTATAGNLPFIKKTFAIAKRNGTNVFWNPGGGELSLGLKALDPYLNQTQVL